MSGIEIVQFLGAIGEFVGAIAVVVTLVYLAAQVRNSAASAQAAAIEAGRTRRISSFESIRDSHYLPDIQAKLQRGEELDEVERLRMGNHSAALWGLLYAEWIQRDLGVLGEYATNTELPLIQALASPAAMQWWDNVGTQLYPQRFVNHIATMMTEIDIEASTGSMGRGGFGIERPTPDRGAAPETAGPATGRQE